MSKGLMVSLEGPDGAGKTSNADFLVKLLESKGFNVVRSREPGGTTLGEKLREILLHDSMVPMAELLIFAAARAQHLDQLIHPALKEGKIVVCDRFADSTYAYQGQARGYQEEVLQLEQFVHGSFEPDHTLFFDVTLEESKSRLKRRNTDINQFDQEKDDFKTRVYTGYVERFKTHAHRMVRIDAMVSLEEVQAQITRWVEEVFVPANRGLIKC